MGRKLYQNKYRTQTLRIKWWDYSENGDYFITIRTNRKCNILGKIFNNEVELNIRGKIVKRYLLEIPNHFENCLLGSWVIMPDHVHLILHIRNKQNMVETQQCCVSNGYNVETKETQRCCVSTNQHNLDTDVHSNTFYKLKPKSIPVIIRSFKSICTRKIHEMENNKQFKWQRSFYDEVIFNDQVLQEIEIYIKNNPKNHHKK